MSHKPKIYTPDEVNILIPQLREVLPALRKIRDNIISEQNKHDIEELTSHGLSGAQGVQAKERMDKCKASLLAMERKFEKEVKIFENLKCELKGLDPGLVDFYSERNGELVCLCWKEDELQVSYWHTLAGGFRGRQPLF